MNPDPDECSCSARCALLRSRPQDTVADIFGGQIRGSGQAGGGLATGAISAMNPPARAISRAPASNGGPTGSSTLLSPRLMMALARQK